MPDWSDVGWMLTGICLYGLFVPTKAQLWFQDYMDDIHELGRAWLGETWESVKDRLGAYRG